MEEAVKNPVKMANKIKNSNSSKKKMSRSEYEQWKKDNPEALPMSAPNPGNNRVRRLVFRLTLGDVLADENWRTFLRRSLDVILCLEDFCNVYFLCEDQIAELKQNGHKGRIEKGCWLYSFECTIIYENGVPIRRNLHAQGAGKRLGGHDCFKMY